MGRSVTSPAAIFEAIRGLSTRMGMARIEYHSAAVGGRRAFAPAVSILYEGMPRLPATYIIKRLPALQIVGQPFSVVDILVGRRTTVHRMPEKGHKFVLIAAGDGD